MKISKSFSVFASKKNIGKHKKKNTHVGYFVHKFFNADGIIPLSLIGFYSNLIHLQKAGKSKM